MKKRKTKELSAAMGESSTSTDQPQTPRKRGRPRKNTSEPRTHKKSDQEYSQGPDSNKSVDIGEEDRGEGLENEKRSKDDNEEQVGPSSKDQPQAEAPRKSRGRRKKSKPRKSI